MLIQEYLNSYPAPSTRDMRTLTDAEVNPLLRQTRWFKFIGNIAQGPTAISATAFAELVSPSTWSPELKFFPKYIHKYIESLTPLVQDCEVLSLQWINSKG